jgi:serine/threonine-protein kinase
MVLGTPLYMSPEQARGEEELDHRIDVYAAGVILYELITGEVPYRGTNYLSIISQVLAQDPKRPSEVRPDLSISPALEAVILKAMAKDRAQRYASMADLDADLARLETGAEVNALSGRLDVRAPPRAPRSRVLAWVLGIAVIVGAVSLVVVRFGRPPETPAPPPAPPPLETRVPAPAIPTPPATPMISVKVQSVPDNAEVWLGGIQRGNTPYTLEVAKGSGKGELTLKLEGYEDRTQQFRLDKDQELPAVKLVKRRGKRPATVRPNPSGTPDPELGHEPDFRPKPK